MFSEKVKEIMVNSNGLQYVNDLIRAEIWHDEKYIKALKPQEKEPKNRIGIHLIHYIQLSLFRSRMLLEGVSGSIETLNPLTCALCIRAHFEITGGLGYALKRLMSLDAGNITIEDAEMSFYRLRMGVRAKRELTEAPDPINVMTLIDAADDLFKRISSDKNYPKIFRGSYDELSEYCHPNFFGLTIGSNVNKIGVTRFSKKIDKFDEISFFVPLLNISLNAFMYFYDRLYQDITKNEELPIIIRG